MSRKYTGVSQRRLEQSNKPLQKRNTSINNPRFKKNTCLYQVISIYCTALSGFGGRGEGGAGRPGQLTSDQDIHKVLILPGSIDPHGSWMIAVIGCPTVEVLSWQPIESLETAWLIYQSILSTSRFCLSASSVLVSSSITTRIGCPYIIESLS